MAINSRDKRFSFMRLGDKNLNFPLRSNDVIDSEEHGAGLYLGLNFSPPVDIEDVGNENRSFKIGISIGF